MKESASDLLRSYMDILNEQPVAPAQTPQTTAPSAPAAAPAPPAAPASQPAGKQLVQKAKQGVASVGKALGAKGGAATAATGLDKIAQGQAVSGKHAEAIKPFIEPLQRILANPQLKQKFMALVQAVKPKQQ